MAPIDHKICFIAHLDLIRGKLAINVPGDIVKTCLALPKFTILTVYKELKNNIINDFDEAEKIFYLKNENKKYLADNDAYHSVLDHYDTIFEIEKLRALPSYFILYKILQCMKIDTELSIKDKYKIDKMNESWNNHYNTKCSICNNIT